MHYFGLIVVLFAFFIFALLAFAVLKKIIKTAVGFAVNAVLGIAGLLFLDLLGFGIGVNALTVAIAAIFGLLGVAVLVLLRVLGVF